MNKRVILAIWFCIFALSGGVLKDIGGWDMTALTCAIIAMLLLILAPALTEDNL